MNVCKIIYGGFGAKANTKHTFCSLLFEVGGPRQLSRYGESLRAGRSGDLIPLWARFSVPVQNDPWAHPPSYTMGTGFFPGGKGPNLGVDYPPHLVPRLKKEQSYTSTPPLGLRGLLQGELYYTDCWGLIYISCRTLQLTSYDVAVISCKNVDWPDGSTVTAYCLSFLCHTHTHETTVFGCRDER